MWERKKHTTPQKRIDSLIGAGTVVNGDVTFTGGLRIDGQVHGNVIAANGEPSTLVISEQARVDGEIRVSHVVINGTVERPGHRRRLPRVAAQGAGRRRCDLQDARDARRRGDRRAGLNHAEPGHGVGGRIEASRFRMSGLPGPGVRCPGRSPDRPYRRQGCGEPGGSPIMAIDGIRKEHRMNAMTEMPAPLVFTDSAAEKVKSLIEEEGNPELKLRVFVTGGGCSGFQYGFTFDEVVNEDDTAMVKNGVTLLIDPMSYQYLVGAEIDYQEGLEGAQFVIKNPNATTTCGCGSSFSA